MQLNYLLSISSLVVLAACSSDSNVKLIKPSPAPPKAQQGVAAYATSPASETLGFSEATLLALHNNPGLKPYNPELRAADGRILQASLKPNPALEGSVEHFAGNGSTRAFDAAESTLKISQLIERGGKLEARRKVQQAEKVVVSSKYEIARRNVFTEVGQAYAQALAAQESVALYQELIELNESFLPEIEKRIAAGSVTEVERSRVKTAITSARLAKLKARREFKIARLRLAATWGSTSAGFDRVIGKLGAMRGSADEASLKQSLLNHPAYRKEVNAVKMAVAANRLAVANGKQDVTVFGGLRQFRQKGEAALVAGASIPLGVNDRNQGKIAATRAEIDAAKKRKTAIHETLMARLASALETLRATRAEADVIANELLPQAEQTLASIEEGYSKGRFGYLDFIEARRSLTDANVQLLATKSAYQQAAAEVSGLTAKLPSSRIIE